MDRKFLEMCTARPGTHFEALSPSTKGSEGTPARLLRTTSKVLCCGTKTMVHSYLNHAFQWEIVFLGIEFSPSFTRFPESNGVAE